MKITILTTIMFFLLPSAFAKPFRIVYTNNTMGYITACETCSGKPAGGLEKRTQAIEKLKKDKIASIIVDSGNITDDETKIDKICDNMKLLGYDALGSGNMDIKFEKQIADACEKRNINLLKNGKYIIKNANDTKIGIISFGYIPLKLYKNDEKTRKNLLSAYNEMREKCDFTIVLDQTNIIDKKWLEQNEQPDIVISGLAKSMYLKPKIIGKTHIVPTFIQAKSIGIIEVDEKISWRKINLL